MPLLDTSQLDQLRAAGQDDTFREIISMYLEQTRSQLSDLQSAIADQNPEETGNIAHQIKGSSANLGAGRCLFTARNRCQTWKSRRGTRTSTGNPGHFRPYTGPFPIAAGRITSFDKRPAPSIGYAQWKHCTRLGASITFSVPRILLATLLCSPKSANPRTMKATTSSGVHAMVMPSSTPTLTMAAMC